MEGQEGLRYELERGSCGRTEATSQACATLRSLPCKDDVRGYQQVDRPTI